MDFAEQQRNPSKHFIGFGIVVLMHVLIGWALANGLAQRMMEVIKGPIETKIIEEVKPPPPPPPDNLPPPKVLPPPPSFVPPPEVNVNAPANPAPTITTTQVVPPPRPVVIAPPPAPPTPVAAPVRTEPKLDFNVCDKPEYNAAARRAEAQGTVVVVYTMDTNGNIGNATVEKSAGPTREHKVLDRLTLDAVLACKGKPGTLDGKAEKLTSRVSYVWKLE